MAEKFVSLAPIGVVTAIVGEVKVTSLDGTSRLLAAGDTVSTGDVVETSANGAVHIQLANGRSVDCGEQFSLKVSENLLDLPSGTRIALDGTVSSPAATADAAVGNTIFPGNTAGSSAPQDIAALQAQIAAGADPSRIAEATAAGGAPGAGGAEAGGSHEPVILEQADTRGTIQSGFTTGAPGSLSFPGLSPQQAVILPASPVAITTPAPATSIPPVISVDLTGVRLASPSGENPTGPADNVTVSGNIVSLVEGTSGGTDPGKTLNFVLTLDKPATADVVVTYHVSALGSETDIDLVDVMGGTVTILANSTQILVPIRIAQDHTVESNEAFQLLITSATNATINPDANTAVLNIINDDTPPLARDDAYSVNEGDSGATLLPSVLTRSDNGESGDDSGTDTSETLRVTTTGTIPTAQGGYVEMNADGTFRYFAPNPDFNGTDSFTYQMTDGFNGESQAVVTLSITPVNDLPVASDKNYSVNEDTPLIITAPDLLANDTPGGDGGTLTVTDYTPPVHGTLEQNPDGSLTYTPPSNYNGPDSFTYSIQDADGDIDTATVSITVNPVNDVPDAVNNAYSVSEDTPLIITASDILDNDTTGGDGGTLAIIDYSQPIHGTLAQNPDGSLTYAPASNYSGFDIFTYTIQDADGDTDTATVSITVNPVDDPPNLTVTSAPGEVFESGLPGGSAAPSNASALASILAAAVAPSTTTTGSLQVGDPDALDSVTHLNINGVDYSLAALADGESIDGSNGTLSISYNAISGVVSYEYTLTDPAFDAADADEQDIFVVKVKDNTGLYSAPAAITINIQDDVPSIAACDALLAAQIDNVVVSGLNLVAGADGAQSLVITGETGSGGLVVDASGNVLTSNESSMTYMQSGGGLYAVTTPGDIGSAVFSVTPDSTTGTYTLQLLGNLDTTKVVLSATFSGPDAGAPDDPYTVQFVDQTGTNAQISHIFGFGSLQVNPSQDGLGGSANVISVGDQIGVWLGTQVASVDIALSKFASHGNGNLTAFSWTAFNIDESVVNIADYEDVGTDATDGKYSLTEFLDSIYVSGSDLMGVLAAGDPAVIIGTIVGGSSVTAPNGPAEESDIDTYALTPDESALFDFIMIEQTDGSMKINGMSFESGVITDDIKINLAATITDGDLDIASSSFQATFSGGAGGSYTLTGGATDEVLQGGSGNDILIGGGGVDVLLGGGGSDTFKFTDATSADVIQDFEVGSGGDVLDVHDLLPTVVQGATTESELGAYLQLVADGVGNTIVMIDADGAANTAPPTAVVTLQGVTGVTLADLLVTEQLKTY